jgi:hypothetical protein
VSIRAIVWAFDQNCPSPAAKLVLIKLANEAGDDSECRSSYAGLARFCGITRQQVGSEIDALIAVGLLTCAPSGLFLAFEPDMSIPIQRQRIFSKTEGRCFYCDTALDITDFHIDHKIPRSKGGSSQSENLVPACAPCNLRKGALSADEFLRRRLQEYAG